MVKSRERPTISQDLPALISVTDACNLVSLSRATIYQLIKDGELEAIRIGRLHRIKTRDFLEYFSLREEDLMKKEKEV